LADLIKRRRIVDPHVDAPRSQRAAARSGKSSATRRSRRPSAGCPPTPRIPPPPVDAVLPAGLRVGDLGRVGQQTRCGIITGSTGSSPAGSNKDIDHDDANLSLILFHSLAGVRTSTVQLSKDVSVDADARLGKPVSVTVPDADATQTFGHVHFTYPVGEFRRLGLDMTGKNFDRMYTAQIGAETPDVFASVSGLWEKPGGGGDGYCLAWHQPGGYPTGFVRKLVRKDLASVALQLASEAANSEGGLTLTTRQVGDYTRGWRVYSPVPKLPAKRTLFHNGDRHTEFQTSLGSGAMEQGQPKLLSYRDDQFTSYQAGRQYHQRWNHGIFGPAFPAPDPQQTWTDREVGISPYGQPHPVLAVDIQRRPRPGSAPGAPDSMRVTVTRDGRPVHERASLLTAFDVPADEGVYEATADFTRGAPTELATRGSPRSGRSAPPTPCSRSTCRWRRSGSNRR
jgi:hypothetical protein